MKYHFIASSPLPTLRALKFQPFEASKITSQRSAEPNWFEPPAHSPYYGFKLVKPPSLWYPLPAHQPMEVTYDSAADG